MIKNWLALVGVALFGLGCSRKPAVPEGFQGLVEYDERVLSFEVSGKVQRVPVRRGDRVRGEDTVVVLDDTLARLARDARVGEVKVAQADLALVKAGARREDVAAAAAQVSGARAMETWTTGNVQRATALQRKEAVPAVEVERAEADRDRASSERRALEQRLAALQKGARPEEIARAEARVSAAATAASLEEERLARFSLAAAPQAPASSWTVLDVHVDPGELAAPGAPVVTLADVTHPYVDVFVPEGQLDGVRVGASADVRVDATTDALRGRVEHVSPRTEFTPRFLFSERERPNLVIRVRVRVDDPAARLHAGVPAFVRIER